MKKNRLIVTELYTNPRFKKGNSKTIFTVCGIEGFINERKIKELQRTFERQRTFGWYSKLLDARKAVRNNECDIRECSYNYMVIEEVKEGVFGMAIKEWWFRWDRNKKKFLSIPKPKETKHIVNWGIG